MDEHAKTPRDGAREYDVLIGDGGYRIGEVRIYNAASKQWEPAPDQPAERRAIIAAKRETARTGTQPPKGWEDFRREFGKQGGNRDETDE